MLAVDPLDAGPLARAPRATAQAEQLRNPQAGLAFHGRQLSREPGGARGGVIEADDDLLDLPAIQAEPTKGREKPRLMTAQPKPAPFAGVETLPVVGRLTVRRLRRVREDIAFMCQAADGRELPQKAAAVRLVVIDRLALLVGLVAHEVTQPHLAVAQPLAESEHAAQRVGTPECPADHLALACLDAAGDLHLAVASEQGDGGHLAEVHADRVD